MNSQNPHIGSSFDEFLAEEGILEHSEAVAIKRVLVWQIEQSMERLSISPPTLAVKMHTSRSSVSRLLNPEDTSLTLATLSKVAVAMGKHVQIALVDNPA